jgi:hypothetical protein
MLPQWMWTALAIGGVIALFVGLFVLSTSIDPDGNKTDNDDWMKGDD